MSRTVRVNDPIQKNYNYEIVEEVGKNLDSEFRPELTPKQMLKLGVFGGNYFDGYIDEYPKDWFKGVAQADGNKKAELNYFKVNASKPLSYWKKKGWIYKDDPRGWFQWYCRYYLGRRIPEEDRRQIKRWKMMRRHIAQLRKNCRGDLACRPRQRQALLRWAYDSLEM